MEKDLEEAIHREELKHFLTKDELTLPDQEREELLIQRKWVDQGIISELDISANRSAIQQAARKSASSRNNFDFLAWVDSLPGWLQAVIIIGAILLVSVITDAIDSIFS